MAALSIKKALKYVSLLVIAAIAMQLLIQFSIVTDAAMPGAESFLRGSPQVAQEVGNLEKVSVTRLARFQGSPGKESPYRQLTFRVKGEKTSGLVVVRAEEGTEKNYSYRIISIEK
jgi:hypothetical protein